MHHFDQFWLLRREFTYFLVGVLFTGLSSIMHSEGKSLREGGKVFPTGHCWAKPAGPRWVAPLLRNAIMWWCTKMDKCEVCVYSHIHLSACIFPLDLCSCKGLFESYLNIFGLSIMFGCEHWTKGSHWSYMAMLGLCIHHVHCSNLVIIMAFLSVATLRVWIMALFPRWEALVLLLLQLFLDLALAGSQFPN